MQNEQQPSDTPKETSTKIDRRAFDVERRPNGDFFIYTFYWDDTGEKRWCANNITESELRRIADGINKFL